MRRESTILRTVRSKRRATAVSYLTLLIVIGCLALAWYSGFIEDIGPEVYWVTEWMR